MPSKEILPKASFGRHGRGGHSERTTPSALSKELRNIFLMRSHPSCSSCSRRGLRSRLDSNSFTPSMTAPTSLAGYRLKGDPRAAADVERMIPNAMNLQWGQLTGGVQGQGGEPGRNKEESRLRRQDDGLLRIHPPNVGEVVLQPVAMREPAQDKRIVKAGFQINSGKLIRPIQGEHVDIAVRVARDEYVDHSQPLFESARTVFQ